MKKIFERLRELSLKLNPMTETRNGPLQSRSPKKRILKITTGADGRNNEGQTKQAKKSVQFVSRLEHVKEFSVRDEIHAPRVISQPNEQIVPKLLSRLDHVNDKGSHVMQLIYHIGRKHYWGLVDTGADQSVMDTEFARKVLENCQLDCEKLELSSPIELIVGDGGLVHVNSAIKLKIIIKPGFAFYVVFVLVPGLIKKAIFGNDFLSAMGAQISYRVGQRNLTHFRSFVRA